MAVPVWLRQRGKAMFGVYWKLLWGTGLLAMAMVPTALANEPRSTDSIAQFGCRNCVRPEYPEDALEQEIEGNPTIEFKVNRYGDVIYARVVRSSGNAELDLAGLAALLQSKFTANSPGDIRTIEFDFSIEGSVRNRQAAERGERSSVLPIPPGDSTQSVADAPPSTVQPSSTGEGSRVVRLSLDNLNSTLENTIVDFEVDRSGQVVDASIAESSGNVSLDQNVLQTVRKTVWTLGSHVRFRTLEAGLPFYPAPELPVVEGQPQVEFEVDENGNVIDARIIRSSGDPALDEAALEAIQDSTFTPSNRP